MKLIILLIALFFQASLQKIGVDVSQSISESHWKCLKSPGGQGPVEYGIVRVYQSNGQIDPNGKSSIENAKKAGISEADGYIFPCFNCKNPKSQISETLKHIKGSGFGRLWLDIERYAWSTSQSANRDFIKQMIDEGIKNGAHLGIYTNYYNWESIVGLSWSYPASKGLPLWYAHYDEHPSFSDFQKFGGWKKPSIKQYKGTSSSCGVGIDYNWKP